jgi:predicted MFS family arabinose efflux permease
VLTAGLLLGGLAFLSIGFVNTYGWLIVAAVLAGLANCVYHPADYSILTDSIPENRIGRAFSIHTFAGFVGSAIAPPLLLGLAAVAGLSSSLVCTGLLAWATAAVVFLMPNQQKDSTGNRRKNADKGNSADVRVFTPTVLALTGFFSLLALSHSAMYSFSTVALIASHGVTLAGATAALTAYLAMSAIGVLVGGVLADRTRRHGDVAALGFALSACIALSIALFTLPVAVLTLAMGATGFVIGIIQPSRDMLVRKAAPPGAAGRVFGIVSTGFNIGGIIGPLLFGYLMDHGSPRGIFFAAVAFMTITAVFAFLEGRRPRRQSAAS